MRRQLILIALLAMSTSACQEGFDVKNSLASGNRTAPENSNGQVPDPTPKPPSSGSSGTCWVYSLYGVGSCESLVSRALLPAADRDWYNYSVSSDARYKAPVRLIDLSKVSLQTQITANFRLGEFMQTFKGRYGFIAQHVFTLVQSIRDHLGVPIRINSGYRSPGYNKKIDGASVSRHMYGDAVDLSSSSATLEQLKSSCKRAGASFIQLYADGHVHCDWRNLPLDSTFMGDDIIRPPTIAAHSELAEDVFVQMQSEIGGTPEIYVSEGEIAQGSTVVLAAAIEHQEDPGELLTEWLVLTPDGRKVESTGSTLTLPLAERGYYEIQVRLGGYLESSYQIQVY